MNNRHHLLLKFIHQQIPLSLFSTFRWFRYSIIMTTFASLSGPDFLKFSRQQIKALSLDELQELVLRSQRLLAKALPVQAGAVPVRGGDARRVRARDLASLARHRG